VSSLGRKVDLMGTYIVWEGVLLKHLILERRNMCHDLKDGNIIYRLNR
jgi:hypothetical protein